MFGPRYPDASLLLQSGGRLHVGGIWTSTTAPAPSTLLASGSCTSKYNKYLRLKTTIDVYLMLNISCFYYLRTCSKFRFTTVL